MSKDIQISAVVSRETRDELERFVRSTGQKKAFVIETALRHHLQALHEIPAEYLVPPLLVVTPKSGRELLRVLRRPRRPTPALRKLIRGR